MLYVAGIGRSGSTLLTRTLGSLGGFLAAGEVMHVFGRGMDRDERCGCGEPFRRCEVWGEVAADLEAGQLSDPGAVDELRHRFTEGRGVLASFLPWKPRSLRRRIGRLRRLAGRAYGALRRSTGCRIVVDSSKSPAWARMLVDAPGVRVSILHLVRDSRGVVHSLGKRKRRPGTDRPGELLDRRAAGTGALLWSAANLLTESLAGRAEGYLRVRYRDFVASPDRTARRVLALLSEEDRGERIPELAGGSFTLGTHHVLSGNPVRAETGWVELQEDTEWRRAMPAARRWLVGALTFPLLRRYGYPLRPGIRTRPLAASRPARRHPAAR